MKKTDIQTCSSIKTWNMYRFHLHPTIKLLFLILGNTMIFVNFGFLSQLIILLVEVFIITIIKLKLSQYKSFLVIFTINLIPTYFLVLLSLNDYFHALLAILDYSIKIYLTFFMIIIFYAITPPYELINLLRSIKAPKSIALGITIAINVFPLIFHTISRIKVIQEARGYNFRLWNLKPILIPSILIFLDQSTELTISMKARGFDI